MTCTHFLVTRLRNLNNGVVETERAKNFMLPNVLAKSWYSQGYYASISHNVKVIYYRYMDCFDGNPAHLWEHPPVDSATHYIDCMSGASAVNDKAKQNCSNQDYRFAATLLNNVVFAEPINADAKTELASVYTQLKYQCEKGT